MGDCRPWLPAAAIARAVEALPVRRIVAEWSAAWFVGAGASVRAATRTPAASATGAGWSADGVSVVPDGDVEPVLRDLALGAPPADAVPTDADTAAVEAVVAACLADLRARLARGLGLAEDVRWNPVLAGGEPACRWAWRVDAGASAMLHVQADEAWVVRQVRDRLPPVRGAALVALAEALAPHPVVVSARVGRSTLTTAELAQLTAGDVVVLDRTTDAPVALAVDGAATGRTCLVEPHDDHLILTLVDRETP